jgi:hypothetical protein
MRNLILILLFAFCIKLNAQTKIYGMIKDTAGYEISFASIFFSDRSQFTNSDIEGHYEIACQNCKTDTLIIKALGYKPQKVLFKKGTDQKIDIVLEDDVIVLNNIVLVQVENPAFAIMRKVIDHKTQNDQRTLSAYQYESYNKIELDIKNLTEDFMEKKILGKIGASLEELEKLVDEEGRQYFPMFISETLSDFYFKDKPESNKEIVKATRSTGIGMTDGSFVSQMAGATFTQFNFYKNSIRLLEKDFISPIADGWRLYYDYELVDSLEINGRFSYELNIHPKNANSLAFVGKIWIDKETYAMSKIDLVIPSSANLNYINTISVKREWFQTTAGPFFPRRTDIVIDANNVNDKWASPLIRSTFTVSDLVVNSPLENKFYEFPIEVKDDAQSYEAEYWNKHRHDTLSAHEKHAFELVDTIKNLPSVKSYIDFFNIVVNGHKDIGKIAIGPYISTYAHNNIENHRFRLGFKTNIRFSKKMFFEGYLAYGTQDKVLKHNFEGRFILSRNPYIEAGFKWRKDIDQLGINQITYNNIFDSFSRWGTLTGAYYTHSGSAYIAKQLNKHFFGSLGVNKTYIDPVFDFGYYKKNEFGTHKLLNTSELELNLKFSHNEGFLQTDYGRQTLGSPKPEFFIKYQLGAKNILNSDFNYHKLTAKMVHVFGMGVLGQARLNLQAGKIFGTLPYPLLNIHLGNETPIYILTGFNMMNYFEFVSDQFVEAKYVHHFNGLFLDRIPLFKRLKWREVVNVTALWGNVSNRNRLILEPNSRVFGTFANYPYFEMGYGIENIFKIFRVELFQRMTYLNRPDVNRFGIKIGLQFTL